MGEHGGLTCSQARALAVIVKVARREGRVARVCTTAFHGVVRGTARHIVTDTDRAGFPGADDDVRDCWLRVTTEGGFEAFWSITELVEQVQTGEFVVYDSDGLPCEWD